MANPNLKAFTTVYGNTNGISVGTSYANVVQNPSSSNTIFKINNLIVTNSCTSVVTINVQLNQAGTNTYISANVGIPSAATVVILGKDTALYLLENNSLQLNASSAGSITAVSSWEQIS